MQYHEAEIPPGYGNRARWDPSTEFRAIKILSSVSERRKWLNWFLEKFVKLIKKRWNIYLLYHLISLKLTFAQYEELKKQRSAWETLLLWVLESENLIAFKLQSWKMKSTRTPPKGTSLLSWEPLKEYLFWHFCFPYCAL